MYSCLEEYKGLEQIKDLQVGEYNSGGNTGNNPTPTQYSRNPGVNQLGEDWSVTIVPDEGEKEREYKSVRKSTESTVSKST